MTNTAMIVGNQATLIAQKEAKVWINKLSPQKIIGLTQNEMYAIVIL